MVVCGAPCRQQLWRELLDMLAAEAMGLRNLLGLPERDMWIDKKEESTISNAGETHRLVKQLVRQKIGEVLNSYCLLLCP